MKINYHKPTFFLNEEIFVVLLFKILRTINFIVHDAINKTSHCFVNKMGMKYTIYGHKDENEKNIVVYIKKTISLFFGLHNK